MSDKYRAFTIGLDTNIDKEEAEKISNALGMIKGVIKVSPHVSNLDSWLAEERAKMQLGQKIINAIYDKD